MSNTEIIIFYDPFFVKTIFLLQEKMKASLNKYQISIKLVYYHMIGLTLNQTMGLFLAVIGIFPSFFLFKLYFQTKISDYLLFGLFFIDGILVLILDPIAGLTNQLIFYQLHHISIDTAFLILFIHACRMSWKRIPRGILFMGVGYYIVLFIMTSMWQVYTQTPSATVIFINLITQKELV